MTANIAAAFGVLPYEARQPAAVMSMGPAWQEGYGGPAVLDMLSPAGGGGPPSRSGSMPVPGTVPYEAYQARGVTAGGSHNTSGRIMRHDMP